MDLALIHSKLGRKVRIDGEEAEVTAYIVRPSGEVFYELTHTELGMTAVASVGLSALEKIEAGLGEKVNVNWEMGPPARGGNS